MSTRVLGFNRCIMRYQSPTIRFICQNLCCFYSHAHNLAYMGLMVLRGLVHGDHVSNKRLSRGSNQAKITWQWKGWWEDIKLEALGGLPTPLFWLPTWLEWTRILLVVSNRLVRHTNLTNLRMMSNFWRRTQWNLNITMPSIRSSNATLKNCLYLLLTLCKHSFILLGWLGFLQLSSILRFEESNYK